MSEQTTALETIPPPSNVTVATSGENFELSATNPEEMVQCHQTAIAWAKRKIELIHQEAEVLLGEIAELDAAYQHAKKCKWKWQALFNAFGTATKRREFTLERVEYYKKMLAAFEAGYYIVPNFPVTLFAIRTGKAKPKRMWARLCYSDNKNFEQEPQVLPAGVGEYVNPQPIVKKDWSSADTKPGQNTTYRFEAASWQQLDFPANMARVHVMDAATRAMDAKIFDEVGFLPQDYKRNPDPLLIGRLIDPRSTTYSKRYVSFIIAWHIDTKTL